MLRGPALRDERGSRRPFSPHAQAKENAKHGELGDGLRQAAGGGEDRVDEDARHERLRSTHAIGQQAEEHAPDRRREQRERSEQARRRGAHLQVAHQVGEDHRVEHDVHAIEHPPQACGHERAALLGRSVSKPRQEPDRAFRAL